MSAANSFQNDTARPAMITRKGSETTMTVFCRAVSPPPSMSTTAVSPVRTPHRISTARCGASEPPEVIMLST